MCQIFLSMPNSMRQVKFPYRVKRPIHCESRELPVDNLLEPLNGTYMVLG